MQISCNERYRIALISDGPALPVSVLKDNARSVSEQLREKAILPLDKVVVYIPNEASLLPVLWALLDSRVTGILVDPADAAADPVEIAGREQATYIIKTGPQATVIFEQCPFPRHLNDGIAGEPYMVIDNDRLNDLFDELDKALQPAEHDVLFLSRDLPFSRRALELVWASSRGLSVVLDSLTGNTRLSRYLRSPDEIEMAFGLFHFGSYIESSDHNKYGLLLDTVRFADEHGFSSVWTPERHFNAFGGLFPNPSVLSAALAVTTTHVQIRSGSIVAPLHHTVRIAEDWSLVDNLSNGRVAISFASGWQCDDFIFFPDNYPQRHECMMTQIENVRRLWRGEKIRFMNGLNREIEIGIFPKPVQKELPVWITVSGKTETFIDAGKIGANILTHLLWQDTEELIGKIAAYRESLRENGFDPRSGKVSVMVHTYLGSSNDAVKDKVREPLKNYIRTSTQLIQSMAKSNVAAPDAKDVVGRYGDLKNEIPAHLMDELLEIAFNRFFEQAGLLGTVEKAVGLIKKLKGYDVDEIAALIDFGLGRDDIMEGLTYLNELKELYKRSPLHPVVTISHCSARDLEEIQSGSIVSQLLDAQRTVLVETDGTFTSLNKEDRSQDNAESVFTSSISEEF